MKLPNQLDRIRKPYALFVLVDITPTAIDQLLKDCDDSGTKPLWLATDDYNDAPVKDPKYASEGTTAPVSKDFKSP